MECIRDDLGLQRVVQLHPKGILSEQYELMHHNWSLQRCLTGTVPAVNIPFNTHLDEKKLPPKIMPQSLH